MQVLEKMTESQAVGAKRRRLEAEHGLLGDVRSERVREGSLADALSDYVERIDTDMVGLLGYVSSGTIHAVKPFTWRCAWLDVCVIPTAPLGVHLETHVSASNCQARDFPKLTNAI